MTEQEPTNLNHYRKLRSVEQENASLSPQERHSFRYDEINFLGAEIIPLPIKEDPEDRIA